MEGKISEYEIHPLCMLFPWLDEQTMEILKEDMKKYGQRDTIKRLKGVIIDGKNRLRALKELDIEPNIEDLPENTNIVAYVKAVGLCRRDLTPTKRIEIAQKLDEYEEKQLPQEEQDKIKEWKQDPKKKEILDKKRREKVAKEAKTTIETVIKVEDIQDKMKKGDKKAEKILNELKEENIKSVTQAHKEIVGIIKKKKHKPHQYTRVELEEQLRESEITIKRLENINSRLINYIKKKGFWDEIKGEFGVVIMTPTSEPTPKQLREAKQ